MLALTVSLGCEKDPPAVESTAESGAEAGLSDAAVDARVVPPVPVPPLDLLRRMPRPPEPIAAEPGALAEGLTRARPALRPSLYTDKILVERPKEGPFSMVHYQLTPDRQKIQAVLATFVDGYADPTRRESLQEAITVRLGEGKPLSDPAFEGTRWTTLPFRIDLRTDKATGDLELLYHARGRVDPMDPPELP